MKMITSSESYRQWSIQRVDGGSICGCSTHANQPIHAVAIRTYLK